MPSKEVYWKNPEKHRSAANAYRLANPEWHRRSGADWARKKAKTDPEFVLKRRVATKKYREANREEVYAATREWFAKNPEYGAQWRLSHLREWIIKGAKSRAKQNNIPFDLSVDDIEIPEFCPVLGIRLDPAANRREPNSLSLDRIIPSRGYVKGNVKVISRKANNIKSNGTAEEHEKVAAYIRKSVIGC